MREKIDRAVCIGNFDGVHLGHRKIISVLIEEAKSRCLAPTILTFSPHPIKFFNGEINLLDTSRKREELLNSFECLPYHMPFNEELASLSPYNFFTEILIKMLNAKLIVVGSDYHFGAKKAGDVTLLKKFAESANIECIAINKVTDGENIVISSSRIRQLILEGAISDANTFLARRYSIEGAVIHGDANGKDLGYPTANIEAENEVIPPAGVYATICKVAHKAYKSMAYIGVKPTFSGKRKTSIEVNIFDFDKDIYGKFVELFFEERLRGEVKFKNIDELKVQLSVDKERSIKSLRDIKC